MQYLQQSLNTYDQLMNSSRITALISLLFVSLQWRPHAITDKPSEAPARCYVTSHWYR